MRRTIVRKSFARIVLAASLIWLAQAQSAMAGSLSVFPVRVDVAANKQFCSLKIGNDAKQAVTVQLRGFRWHQDEGTDALDETQSVAVNPSIVTIPPGADKLVRCSLPEHVGPAEKTYRIIVSELPRADLEPGTLQTLLQLSVPVFHAELNFRPAIVWAVTEDGHMMVSNVGTRHVRIADLIIQPTGAAPLRHPANFYLLAGASRIVDTDMRASGIAQVEAMTEDGLLMTVSPKAAVQP